MAEVEFRDGKHHVPDHLADLMRGLETHRLTVEEATQQANQRLLRDRLNKAQDDAVKAHFREWRINQ